MRFDISGEGAETSLGIDEAERGEGFGTAAIKSGLDLLTEPVRRIIAHIRRDNPASMVAFERAGFCLRGDKQIAGVGAYEMI